MNTRDVTSKNLSFESHFEFGQNWTDYAKGVTQEYLDSAIQCLKALLGVESLDGVRMLDIGCGSGIHAVAAATLGAHVTAVDLDPKCVSATQAMCERFNVADRVETCIRSVFDLEPSVNGVYDLVYSWGVLHHTGAMWPAIESAAKCVAPEGQFALAIYRRTKCCRLWQIEKKIYSNLPRVLQFPVQVVYTAAVDIMQSIKRRQLPTTLHRDYKKLRGMSRWHDVHDWLGGYPYESARPREIDTFLTNLGFVKERGFKDYDHRVAWGLPGSGCAEYIYRLKDHASSTTP